MKQTPRLWYLKFDSFVNRKRYKKCAMGQCCYVKDFGPSYIILLLYVDDMLVACSNMDEINILKA